MANGNGKTLPDMPANVLTKSVQQEDVAKYIGAGVVNFLIPAFGGAYLLGGSLPPELPNVNQMTPYSKARDAILVMTPHVEGEWANAQHIATSKIVSRGVQFNSPIARRVDNMNKLFRVCDGRRGFASFLERTLQDYFNCTNGAWVEIERAHPYPGAKILSFNHLDSLRVWRTGDPEIPAIYWDLRGGYHEMKWWECFDVTDTESPRAGFWYGGRCASERAYMNVRSMAAMTKYFDEKITGAGYQKIVFIPGTTVEQIENAKKTAESEQLAKGIIYYQGALMIPYYGDANSFKDKIEVQLKGLPDDWKRQEELDRCYLAYANTLGIAPFELDPRLTARGSLGVGQQSQIIDENEKGRGQGSFTIKLVDKLDTYVLPESTTILFVTIDLREEELKAKIAQTRAQTRATMRGTSLAPGELTPEQSLYMAVEQDDAPDAFLDATTPVDQTMTTEEKPESDAELAKQSNAEAAHSAVNSAPNLPEPTPKPVPFQQKEIKGHWESVGFSQPRFIPDKFVTTKEKRRPATSALIQSEIGRARELYRKARSNQVTTKESQSPQVIVVQPHPQSINFTMPQAKEAPAPILPVTVNLPEMRPEITVQVAPSPAPQVTVNNQPANVEVKPQINVAPSPAPNVEVKPTINIPKQDTPKIVVNVPEQKIEQPTEQTLDVERDERGFISRIIKRPKK